LPSGSIDRGTEHFTDQESYTDTDEVTDAIDCTYSVSNANAFNSLAYIYAD
jgi:hypothetical protein